MASESLAVGGKLEIETQPDHWNRVLKAAIIFGLLVLVYTSFSSDIFRPLSLAAGEHQQFRFIAHLCFLWVLLASLMLVFRTFLWFLYRPFASVRMAGAPPLTVIIPAYNEGPMIEKT